MNNASKLSILAAVVLLGGAAASAGLSACTTTITSGPLNDDGGFDDQFVATDSPAADNFVAPTDGGVDAPAVDAGACPAIWAACPVLHAVSFGTTPCNDCDLCVQQNCCAGATGCYGGTVGSPNPAVCVDGGVNCACEGDCVAFCDNTDGGTPCTTACQAAYGTDSGATDPDTEYRTMSSCIATNCAARCPGN